MEKTSKIKVIHKMSEKPNDNGIYFYDLEMENGDRGSIGKKKINAFILGENLTYTLEPGKFEGKFYLKEVRQNKRNGSSKASESPQEKFIGFALAYAKDIAVAQIQHSELFSTEAMLNLANEMYGWMNNKYLGLQSEKKIESETKVEQPKQEEKSDLISPKQITLIKTLWTKTKLDESNIRSRMKTKFGVDSSKDLTKGQASEFIDQLQKRSEEDEKTPSEEKMPREE